MKSWNERAPSALYILEKKPSICMLTFSKFLLFVNQRSLALILYRFIYIFTSSLSFNISISLCWHQFGHVLRFQQKCYNNVRFSLLLLHSKMNSFLSGIEMVGEMFNFKYYRKSLHLIISQLVIPANG